VGTVQQIQTVDGVQQLLLVYLETKPVQLIPSVKQNHGTQQTILVQIVLLLMDVHNVLIVMVVDGFLQPKHVQKQQTPPLKPIVHVLPTSNVPIVLEVDAHSVRILEHVKMIHLEGVLPFKTVVVDQ